MPSEDDQREERGRMKERETKGKGEVGDEREGGPQGQRIQ